MRRNRARRAPVDPRLRAPAEPSADDHRRAARVELVRRHEDHVLRVGLKGRKGHWVGKLVQAEPEEQRLTVQVRWMKQPRTVSFADVAIVEARTADKASKFGPVRLDA